MSETINAGTGLVIKDPDASKVYIMDWDTRNLPAAVTITTSTWIVALLSGAVTSMTNDSASIQAGNRKTQLRLIGGTLGQVYKVTNRIITNENPTQTEDASFTVLIQSQ